MILSHIAGQYLRKMTGARAGGRKGPPMAGLILMAIMGTLVLALACSRSETASDSPPSQAAPTPTSVAEPSATDQTPSSPSSVPPLRSPSGPPPRVDTSIASVPLADVVFDTFRGGFIRLSEATDDAIESLRDRIKPIYVPKYDSVNEGNWMSDEDMVIGFSSQSGAFAYPVKMLNLHELVNDVIDGEPVLITYCPLCVSGVVYSRRLDDRVLLFGNTSALYESDLVMYDHETGSYWYQTLGEAIVGPLTGQRLTLLPAITVPWGEWKRLHPDTRVLSRNLGLIRSFSGNPYDRDPFAGYDSRVNRGEFIFPVDLGRQDSRLRLGDRVLAVQVGDSHKAYLLTGRPDEAINDEVGGENVVVFVREDGPSGSAYSRSVGGQTLTFRLDGASIVDQESGSAWNFGGLAISGPLSGTQLEPVPSRTSFWFSLVALLPDVELHE